MSKDQDLYVQFRVIPTRDLSWQNVHDVASRGAVNQDCGIDRLGQIQPSDLWCEELVHLAA